MRCGIFVMIRDNRLVMFVSFCNKVVLLLRLTDWLMAMCICIWIQFFWKIFILFWRITRMIGEVIIQEGRAINALRYSSNVEWEIVVGFTVTIAMSKITSTTISLLMFQVFYPILKDYYANKLEFRPENYIADKSK